MGPGQGRAPARAAAPTQAINILLCSFYNLFFCYLLLCVVRGAVERGCDPSSLARRENLL